MLSVGLPCYNAVRTLPIALRSIFAQTRDDWELIIADDGSTDGSSELLRRLDDPRVRLVQDGHNVGLATRLNQIARLARGDLLVRMDADDIMFPDRLARQSEYLESTPRCNLLGSAIVCIDVNDQPRAQRATRPRVVSAYQVLAGEILYHPSVAGRTEWFRQHPYDESYVRSEDFELWCRAEADARIHNLHDPVLFYREYGLFSLPKYLLYSNMTKRALVRHGPARIGWLGTAWLVGRRYLKDAAYFGLSLFGGSDLAVDLRNRPLPADRLAELRAILAAIKRQPLPGVD